MIYIKRLQSNSLNSNGGAIVTRTYIQLLYKIVTALFVLSLSFRSHWINSAVAFINHIFHAASVNRNEKKFINTIFGCIVFLVFSLKILDTVPFYFAEGRADINMKSIYYKNDTQIPVFIEIKGSNFFFNASLCNEDHYCSYNISMVHPEYVTGLDWLMKQIGRDSSANESPRPRTVKGRKYLFNWNEVPGNDSIRFIEFLKQDFNISNVETATIEKIDNDRNITVTYENNSISLRLNNESTNVSLKIDDRIVEFIANGENGALNIYENHSTLIGTVLDKQSYEIFINTTELNEGYYQLVILHTNGKRFSKGFYLLQ